MAFNTVVSFQCSCGEMLRTTFNTELFNYHQCNCSKCGTIYEISRPVIDIRTNFSISDKVWLFENGFSDEKIEMPKVDESVLRTINERYLKQVAENSKPIFDLIEERDAKLKAILESVMLFSDIKIESPEEFTKLLLFVLSEPIKFGRDKE